MHETGLIFEVDLHVLSSQVGMQTGILDGHYIRIRTRLVYMLMPVVETASSQNSRKFKEA